ncbi:MAG: hypothetical protein U0228_06825 [Myxococcaceae bacterium]
MSPLALTLSALVLAADPAGTSASTTTPREKLRLGVDYRWWGRNLQFSPAANALGTSIGTSPTGATFDVQWFPAAYFVDDRGADVGVFMRVDLAPEFITRMGGSDARFTSSATQLRTGLLFRLPMRYAEPSFHAGLHLFEATASPFASDGTPRPRVPNVTFQGPRVAVGLRLLEFWRITFDIGIGATWLLGMGELSTAGFFPGARGSAFDGKAGLAFRTWTWLDVRLGFDLTVHALTLGAGQTATDAYYGVSLGIVFKGVP